jgi:hypothetical protein
VERGVAMAADAGSITPATADRLRAALRDPA